MSASKNRISFLIFFAPILLGLVCGSFDADWLNEISKAISILFIHLFKCLSLPLVATSIADTLASHKMNGALKKIWHRTLFYTVSTTLIAASITALLYFAIQPSSFNKLVDSAGEISSIATQKHQTYLEYLVSLVPSNILEPFLNQQVVTVLFLSLGLGIATRMIPEEEPKKAVLHLLKGSHEILLVFTRWVIKILPIGLFGFIAQAVIQFRNGEKLSGIAEYLAVIVFSNLIQGLIVLPLWLRLNKISPWFAFKGMFPALAVAFVSKSSAGTMPITLSAAEKNLGIRTQVSRFVLPLCTTINMNGCATFIFGTVIFVMQNHGIEINIGTVVIWILVSTLAAIGNAGVPMGCFFLSASLLSSRGIPISILGLILPFYAVIDMIETALNVWSDSCVAAVVEQRLREDEGMIPSHKTSLIQPE